MSEKIFYIISGANGSGKTSFAKSYATLDKNESFIIETTLSGKYLLDIITKAKAKAKVNEIQTNSGNVL